jgi:hypothetical protein
MTLEFTFFLSKKQQVNDTDRRQKLQSFHGYITLKSLTRILTSLMKAGQVDESQNNIHCQG